MNWAATTPRPLGGHGLISYLIWKKKVLRWTEPRKVRREGGIRHLSHSSVFPLPPEKKEKKRQKKKKRQT